MLDQGLLDRLEERLRAEGALIVDAWAPGLADEQIDALLQPLGIDLPDEARVWWRWHNGILPDAPARAGEITPFRILRPLEVAAELYASERHPLFDAWGREGLLTPVSEKPLVYFSCAGPRGAPVPIYTEIDETVEPQRVLLSIGDLVSTWIDVIDRGIWATNPDGTWAIDHGKVLPPDLRRLGIY